MLGMEATSCLPSTAETRVSCLGLCSEGWGAWASSSAKSTESAEDEMEAKGSKRSQSGCHSD